MAGPLNLPLGSFIAPFALETLAGQISPRRLGLLAAIGRTGSISAAAREVGITYKAAWDAVEAMNNLAGDPLVLSQQGGRGGGGAELTQTGQRIVDNLDRLEALQKLFLANLGENEDLNESLALMRRITMKSSARNVLHGVVESVADGAVNADVQMRLGGGGLLHAVITRESSQEMELVPGSPVQALIKASWIILTPPDEAGRTSAGNRLCGMVKRIVMGEVNAEIVLELPGGNTLVTVITRQSAESMSISVGMPLCALINASHIILARQD
jgi:molybdate transport system regulatory protein